MVMVYWLVSFIIFAGFGALFRYKFLSHYGILWGTLSVNLIGSLLMGFLSIYLHKHYPQAKVFILVAFLGSLTTFSTYAFDLVKLFEQGMFTKALSYAVLSNLLCFSGCLLGWKIGQSLVGNY